ncbi:MAG TPA: DUF3108 domain-containing protein [Bacteroidota bacterium]|jgi:hypothetical protein
MTVQSSRRFLFVLPAALLALSPTLAGQPVSTKPPAVLLEGEELIYNVRYGFIDLGQVRIRAINRISESTFTGYYGKAKIDSYPSIPFVDLHAIYESVFDTSIFSRNFLGKSKEDKDKLWDFSRYHFDYLSNKVFMEKGEEDSIVLKRDTMEIATHYQDGLSLFFYARQQLTAGETKNIPTFIKEQKVNTVINFHNKRTSVEVDAIDYPVDVVEFDGTAQFVGIFGLTGDFEGWFSNDEARVPILAKMKVIIGSVTIELMKWKRIGWIPPRGLD